MQMLSIAAIELMPDEVPPQRVVPLLLDIANRDHAKGGANSHQHIADYCRRRNDALGCAAALHAGRF